MIKRIVKLSFITEEIPTFKAIFAESKDKIRAFPGCQHLELWQTTDQPHIFFTYSYWASEKDLNAYRHSDLFKKTWAKTKVLFNDQPQAWSVHQLDKVELPKV